MSDPDVHPHEMPDDLDTFLHELRSSAAASTPPAAGPALATLFRDGAAPLPSPSRRRRTTLRVAVAGGVAALGLSGLGVAGALPAPVQDRVADIAEHVGVELPHGRPDPTPPSTVPPEAETPAGRSSIVDDTPAVTRPVPPPVDERGRSEEHRADDDTSSRAPSPATTDPGRGDHAEPGLPARDEGPSRTQDPATRPTSPDDASTPDRRPDEPAPAETEAEERDDAPKPADPDGTGASDDASPRPLVPTTTGPTLLAERSDQTGR